MRQPVGSLRLVAVFMQRPESCEFLVKLKSNNFYRRRRRTSQNF